MNLKTYACYNNDNSIRMESSSGGLFSVIAEQFEVVYGVAMTKDCYGAEFIRTENDISPLRGSKYFQAKIGDAFTQVKKDLDNGKHVLFSGTGCQINGLHSFLQKDYPNLFSLDVICHGTPSPKLWREYAKYQEGKHGKLEQVNFRCKDDSWVDFGMKENQMYISKDTDSFMRMFLRDYCLRPSCYECHAKLHKTSDITLADFWGIENVAPEMNDGNGTSLVITRTEKGQQLFEKVKSELKWIEVRYEEGVKCNPSEYTSVKRPKERDNFYSDLSSLTFEQMENKYASEIKIPLHQKLIRKAKTFAKKILRVRGGKNFQVKSNADYGMLFTFKK